MLNFDKYKIEFHDGNFYVFTVDKYGNKYDTMRHFKSEEMAQAFIAKEKGKVQHAESK
jgi:hypothetical protein